MVFQPPRPKPRLPWICSTLVLTFILAVIVLTILSDTLIARDQLMCVRSFSLWKAEFSNSLSLADRRPSDDGRSADGRPDDSRASGEGKNSSSDYTVGDLDPPLEISLEELYTNRTAVRDVEEFEVLSATPGIRSTFLPNRNLWGYPILAMENVCVEPGGELLLVGVSEEDIRPNVSGRTAVGCLAYVWDNVYKPCGNTSGEKCAGVRYTMEQPVNVSWVRGNTLHFIPYLGNSFHNFAERVWPRLVSLVPPFNTTTPQPIHHFFVHRLAQWHAEAPSLPDRNQILWQIRVLMEMWPGSDLLRRREGSARVVCFERFLLQMFNRDRLDHTRIPPVMSGPALRRFRHATFRFLGMRPPVVPTPPRRLRLLYYGRSDASRRRVVNNDEVLSYLRNISRPRLEVRCLDDMLKTKQIDSTFLSLISLLSQTDIFVVAHGAITWGTLFMPEGGAVLEVFGPCDWMKSNRSDLNNMHSWITPIAIALKLKHDNSNPFREAVPNPKRGNTVLCLEPFRKVPDYTLDPMKIGDIISSFAYPDYPHDPLTPHWLHNWDD